MHKVSEKITTIGRKFGNVRRVIRGSSLGREKGPYREKPALLVARRIPSDRG